MSGTLHVRIDGTTFDRHIIPEFAIFDGAQELALLDSYEPALGEMFEIITFVSDNINSRVFDEVRGADLGSGTDFKVNCDSSSVALEVVSNLS